MHFEESCQESSALGFVTSLGVPDIIGNDTVSLVDLSEKTAADKQFLGAYAQQGHITDICSPVIIRRSDELFVQT